MTPHWKKQIKPTISGLVTTREKTFDMDVTGVNTSLNRFNLQDSDYLTLEFPRFNDK